MLKKEHDDISLSETAFLTEFPKICKEYHNMVIKEAEKRIKMMLHWDVNNGIARRSWAQNPAAKFAIQQAMKENPDLSNKNAKVERSLITRLIFVDNTFFHGAFKNRDIKHGCSFETLISIA